MIGPLRNLPVAQKLFASFGVLCLLTIGVGAIGLVELARADHRLERMYSTNLQSGILLGHLRADVQEARALTARLILHSPAADIGNIEQAVQRLDADIDNIWAKYTAGGNSPDAVSFATDLAGKSPVASEQFEAARLRLQCRRGLGLEAKS